MTIIKRRKLDTVPAPPPQSAIARLRNLRSQAGTSPAVTDGQPSPKTEVEVPPSPTVVGDQAPTPKRPKRTRVARAPAAKEDVPTPVATPPLAASNVPTPDIIQSEIENVVESVAASQEPVVQFSSFKPKKSNFRRKAGGKLQLRLAEGERLVILGSYGITVVSGRVTLYGAVLQASGKTQWVHASHCHALPVMRCPVEAVIDLAPSPAAQSLRQLGLLSPLFRRLWNDSSDSRARSDLESTFSILYTSADGPKRVLLSELKSPPEWNREIDTIMTAPRTRSLSVIVTGPKSAGKSTFGRLLANQLLTDKPEKRQISGVAILDLDPGQPEHGPPGQISLVHVSEPVINPSFCRTLPTTPSGQERSIVRSHTLASVSPASDPDLYLSAVMDLLTHYRNRMASMPLVVNTPGWVQGTGLDLLTSVIESARPTHVIYMAPGPIDVVDALQASFRSGTITKLPSQSAQYSTRTAAHLRTMQTMSYFHGEVKDSMQTWNPDPLSATPPWCVRYAGSKPDILGIMCYDYQAPSTIIADALNGTILAIVEIESPMAFDLSHMRTRTALPDRDEMDIEDTEAQSFDNIQRSMVTGTPEDLPLIQSGVTLDPRYSQTIGLALLRGIDTQNRVLHLLSPVTEERVAQVYEKGGRIVLVSGRFDPPSWAYTEDLYHQSSTSNEVETDEQMDIIGEDEAIDSDHEPSNTDLDSASMPTPWIEVLRGNQARGNGARVWRVRRDLGRANNSK